jgi:hypothetical protein
VLVAADNVMATAAVASQRGAEKVENILVDPACTCALIVHTAELRDRMYDVVEVSGERHVLMNRFPEKVQATGSIRLRVKCALTGREFEMRIDNVLYVPGSQYAILGWRPYVKMLERLTGVRVEGRLTVDTISVPVGDGQHAWASVSNGLYYLQRVKHEVAVVAAEQCNQLKIENSAHNRAQNSVPEPGLDFERAQVQNSVPEAAKRDSEDKKDFQPSPVDNSVPAVAGQRDGEDKMDNSVPAVAGQRDGEDKKDFQPSPVDSVPAVAGKCENKKNFQPSSKDLFWAAAQNRVRRMHRRLGHRGLDRLQAMIETNGRVFGFTGAMKKAALAMQHDDLQCAHCGLAMVSKKHPRQEGAPKPHDGQWTMDMAGPNKRSQLGNRWKAVVVAPKRKAVFLFFGKYKTVGREALMRNKARWEMQTGEKMKYFRTDGGKEIVSPEFQAFLDREGILHTKTATGTSAGEAESFIGWIQRCGQANLNQAKELPDELFWDFAERHAQQTQDVMPRRALEGISMYEHRTKRKPNYSKEHAFGCIAGARKYQRRRGKNAGTRCYYLCRAPNGDDGWIFWDPATSHTFISNSAWFDDDRFSWRDGDLTGVAGQEEQAQQIDKLEEQERHDEPKAEQEVAQPLAVEGLQGAEQEHDEKAVEVRDWAEALDGPEPMDVVGGLNEEDLVGRPVRNREPVAPRFDPSAYDLQVKFDRDMAMWAKERRAMITVQNTTMIAASQERRRRRKAERRAWKQSRTMYSTVLGEAKHSAVLGEVNTVSWWEQQAGLGEGDSVELVDAQKDVKFWPYYKVALEKEVAQQKAFGTYVREPIVPGQDKKFPRAQTIGVKYVFEKKRQDKTKPPESFAGPEFYTDEKGEVWKFKARWVARGDQQHKGTYGAPYAPTPVLASLLLIVALSVGMGWDVHSLDARGAFLVPRLPNEEKTYLEPPKGDEARGKWLFLLLKCIYGLRQSGARWREHAKERLRRCGFEPTKADPCVFVKYDGQGELVCAIGLHVDDFLVGASDNVMVVVKRQLNREIDLDDDGRVSWFLKIRFTWSGDRKTVYLTQPEYIEQIVEAAGMVDARIEQLPGRPGEVLLRTEENEEEDIGSLPFLKVLGMVSYVSAVLRPDITYYVAAVQRCAAKPRLRHWKALQHVVAYLAGTKDYGIRYSADLEESDPSCGRIVGYADSDHARDPQTRESISGGTFRLNRGPLSWFSKQNKHVTRSTMESEVSALDKTAKEGLFLRKLAMELKVEGAETIPIYEDNEACEKFANSPKITSLNKHIDIKFFAIRDDVAQGRLKVLGISTDKNVADLFTKPLDAPTFLRLRQEVGIVQVPSELA